MKIFHTLSWVPGATACFCGMVIHDPSSFVCYPDYYSCGFDLETQIGWTWHWIDFGISLSSCTLEMSFNIMSIVWVYQKRKQIETLAASENRRREIKLLIQCFIIGMFFTLCTFTFALDNVLELNSVTAFLVTEFIWILNHCVNPLVYLSVNSRLRSKFIKLLFRGKCGKPAAAVGPATASVPVPPTGGSNIRHA